MRFLTAACFLLFIGSVAAEDRKETIEQETDRKVEEFKKQNPKTSENDLHFIRQTIETEVRGERETARRKAIETLPPAEARASALKEARDNVLSIVWLRSKGWGEKQLAPHQQRLDYLAKKYGLSEKELWNDWKERLAEREKIK